MAVLISLGGNAAGDGFLVAPLGTTYDAELALWTDTGTASVTLQASPNPAALVFSPTGPISLSTTKTVVHVHSTLQSGSRGDTTIQVLEGTTVVASFNVTSIKHPQVNFSGRFEARFSTDNARPYFNPVYQAPPAPDLVLPLDGSQGSTFGLEGEPNFVPVTGTVPTNLEMTGVGRVVRLNSPVALRSPALPVVSTVVSISGETAGGTETFTAGDPLITQPVNFGPDTYMAGNTDDVSATPGSPAPEEYWSGGFEPLALFEINIGAAFSPPAIYFKGASKVGPFTHKAAVVNSPTRVPDSRPFAAGEIGAPAAGYTAFGIPPNLQTFAINRLNALLVDYAGLPAGPSVQRRNLVRRIGHLLGSLDPLNPTTAPTIMTVQGKAVAPDVFTIRMGAAPDAWTSTEQYTGTVDTALHAWPGGSPGASSVVAYLTQFFSFVLQWNPFAFTTDENCGYHTGFLTGDLSMTGNHIGDPHVHTVNGVAYDFQSAGEFTLLRDGNRMEIQVRQTPVPTANPIADVHSGLTECVSVNTAVAVRLGRYRISLQPGPERQRLELYVDGKPAQVPADGIELGGNHVTAFAANGETGIRVDFEDGTVVLITPRFWNAIWLLDVSVSHTSADEGVMGFIPKGSWLPRLRNGVDVGPRPASLHDRYVTLYKTFADSWRVTEKTSLFVYAPGTSTKTFTDPDWPAEKLPCKLKPEFQIPGFKVQQGMPIERAEAICRVVTDKALYQNCVFDVATTGDEAFAKGYVFAQEIRLYSTKVTITCHQAPSRPYRPSVRPDVAALPAARSTVVTATVVPLTPGRPIPTGTVTVFVDGVAMNRPTPLDDRGRARVKIAALKPGEHKIRATYSGGGKFDYHSSSSSSQVCTVGSEGVRL
jgi:Bacterial Ig-like domain (group 3)/Repulsive guidance molecule (RGM) C-terminus